MSNIQPTKAHVVSSSSNFVRGFGGTIEIAVEIVSKMFAAIPYGLLPFSISIEPATKSVDERVARLDEARNALMEGLQAIDELRDEADRNKQDLAAALAELSTVQVSKATAERELYAVKEAVNVDIEVFRSLARIPNEAQIRRERLMGFITGVLASILASTIWWAGSKLVG